MFKVILAAACILNWSTPSCAGFAGSLAQSTSTTEHLGKYINKTDPNEILRLNSDGTFSLVEHGRYFSGKYSMQNEVLTLKLAGPTEITAKFRDANTLEDKEGNVLIKEAEYTRLSKLEAEFQRLLPDARRLRSAYSDPATSPEQRLAVGRVLQRALQKLADNRSAVLPAGGDDGAVAVYRAELAALERDLSALDAAVKAERLRLIKAKLSSNQGQCAKLKLQLEIRPSATLEEWRKKAAGAVEYRQLLDERKNLIIQLQSEGESTQDLVNALAAEIKNADVSTSYLDLDHKQVQILQLNTDYKIMERERLKLLDEYTRAFGSEQERSALQAVLAHLESMLRNRNATRQLGLELAGKQILQLESEIAQLRRR